MNARTAAIAAMIPADMLRMTTPALVADIRQRFNVSRWVALSAVEIARKTKGGCMQGNDLDPAILERVTRGRAPRESMTNDERLQAWAAKLATNRRVRFNPQMHAHLREVERSNGERNHGQ